MKRSVALLIVLVALGLQAVLPLTGMAQSREDAIRLHKEAYALQQKARSHEDLKQAAEKYEEALRIYNSVGDRKNAAFAYNSVGLIYKDWGKYDKAMELFEKSLAIRRDLKDRAGEGMTLNNMAIVYESWGKYDKAMELFEKSLAIRRDLKDRAGEGATLNNMAIVYKDWGKYDKAMELYEKDLAICRELKDRKGEGKTLNNMANVYEDWGKYDKAMELYEKSLAIKRDLKDRAGEGATIMNMANVYKGWGKYDKAMELYEKSLAIRRDLKDRAGEGATIMNMANVYTDWGKYDKAMELYEKDLAIFRDLKDRAAEGGTIMNMALVYTDWGKYDKAMELYEKSLAIKRDLKDRAGEGKTLSNIADVYGYRGEMEQAVAHYQRSRVIYKELKISAGLPTDRLGHLYLDMERLPDAEPLIKEFGLARSMGRLHLMKGEYPQAREQYEKLLKRAETNRNADNLFTAWTGLGAAAEGQGDPARAAEEYRKAVEHVEELRSSLDPAQRETFFEAKVFGFRRTAPYEGLARVLMKLSKPVEAFKESEATRARMFAEAISKRHGSSDVTVPPDILEKDQRLKDELGAFAKRLQEAYEKGSQQTISVLEPQVKKLKADLAAHIEILRNQYPLFAATRYPQPMDLSQTALRENEWVLSYDVGDPGLIVYLTRGKTLQKALFKPVPRKELDRLVRKFIEPLDIKPGEDITEKIKRFDFASGHKLAEILLADVLPDLPKDTPLIVVPADCLGVLPFEMLLLNAGGKIVDTKGKPNISGAEFFGDRNPISYYQSITALTLARNFAKQKGSGNKTLVMCDPVFSDDDPRFVKARKEERRAVLDRLTSEVIMSAKAEHGVTWPRMALTLQLGESLKKADPTATDMYEGLRASKATFKQQKLDQYKSIVFATHGYAGMDLGGLKEPVLVLTLVNQPEGEDGFLRMSEVMGLKMSADVVALTACQSGLGKRVSGEGTMGMGRAFQYAGAKSALMTLWSVAQSSSVQLTESFFKHLKDGKPKLESLKLARDEIRKSGYDHPFFWAPFILVGEVN